MHSCFTSLPFPFVLWTDCETLLFLINPAIFLCRANRWQWKQLTFKVTLTIAHPKVYIVLFCQRNFCHYGFLAGEHRVAAASFSVFLLRSVSPGEAMTKTRPDGAGERGIVGCSQPDQLHCIQGEWKRSLQERKSKKFNFFNISVIAHRQHCG